MPAFLQHFCQPDTPGYRLENAMSGPDRRLRGRVAALEGSDGRSCTFLVGRAQAGGRRSGRRTGEPFGWGANPVRHAAARRHSCPARRYAAGHGAAAHKASPACKPLRFQACGRGHAPRYWQSGSLHRVGENILIFLLVLATNPVTAETPVLRRDHKLVYLSRAPLDRRYGRAWTDRDPCGAGEHADRG